VLTCKQGKTPRVAPPPREWLDEAGATWAEDVLSILTQERKLRRSEHQCLDRLRGAGVIR